jgi:hypothetical protein
MGLLKVNATKGVRSNLSENAPFIHIWSGQIKRRSTPDIIADILARYDIPLTTDDFRFGHFGKPEAANSGSVSFNLTNDRDLFALAVTDFGDIGVDLQEAIDSESRSHALEEVFSPEELELLTSGPDRFNVSVYWAVKEALVKQEGSSIWFGMNLRVVDRLGRNSRGRWIELENRYVYASDWMGMGFALAVPGGQLPPEPIFMNENE